MPVSVLAVIVLYKLEPRASISYTTLLAAQARARQSAAAIHLTILLVDNTPGGTAPQELPEEVLCLPCAQNLGLANAYNRAIELAEARGCQWLLTLDQDTSLPEDFLVAMGAIAAGVQATPAIAAIVPRLVSGGEVFSPNYFLAGAFPAWFPPGFDGVPRQDVFAFNSAAMVRVDALMQLGGYDPWFWLDNSDAVMFRRLHQFGKRVFVGGSVHVEHEFSMKAMRLRISPWRYRHMLLAESAFWDAEMNAVAGVERTVRLFLRLFKHIYRRDPRPLQALTLRFLALRLFRSRAYRRRLFRQAGEQKLGAALPLTALPARPAKISVCMAAYNGGPFVEAQLRSILPQLRRGDEVVIVDDRSTDDTRDRIRKLIEERGHAPGEPGIRLIEHGVNRGVVRTFEDALRQATGDLLFLADDDDLWAPEKVERFLAAFAQGTSGCPIDLVTSAVSLIDLEGRPYSDPRWDRGGRFRRGVLVNIVRNHYQGAATALRSTLLRHVLPFPRGRGYLHDVWIGTMNDRRRGGVAYLPEPLLYYRRHPGNYSRKLSRLRQLSLRLQLICDHLWH